MLNTLSTLFYNYLCIYLELPQQTIDFEIFLHVALFGTTLYISLSKLFEPTIMHSEQLEQTICAFRTI